MLYLPQQVANELKTKRQIEAALKRIDNLNATLERKEELKREYREKSKNTKPLAVMEMVNGRPIVVVGAGQHWAEDLRDLARRRGEREMFDKGRKFTPMNPGEALQIAYDKYNRQSVGLTVHHIKNNPISKREV